MTKNLAVVHRKGAGNFVKYEMPDVTVEKQASYERHRFVEAA